MGRLTDKLREREEGEPIFVAFEGASDSPERLAAALRKFFEHDCVEPIAVSHRYAADDREVVASQVVTTLLTVQVHALLRGSAEEAGAERGLLLIAGDTEQRTEEFIVPSPEVRTPLFARPVLGIDPSAGLPFGEPLEHGATLEPAPADRGILPGFEHLAPERLAEEAERFAREAAERVRREVLESGRDIDWDEAYD